MHTHLVAGAFYALAICLAVGALLAVIVHATGRRNIDFLLFAGTGIMVSVYSLGLAVAYQNAAVGQAAGWVLGIRMARASAEVAIATNVLFALRLLNLRRPALVMGFAAVPAVVLGIVIMVAPVDVASVQFVHARTYGLDIMLARGPASAPIVGLMSVGLFMHTVSCTIFGHSYLRGRRESLALFMGSSLLGLTLLNDVLVGIGVLRGIHLMPAGFIGFAFAVALFFALHYGQTRGELSRRMKELRERTVELTQSRDQLRAVRTELDRKEQLAAIGEMAAVIAHEVRNPLAVIANAVASLRREGLCRHDHDVLLGILDEEAVRLNRLVTDLLAYARPINLQRQRVILQELVQRAMALSANRGAVRFEFAEASAKGQVWADANLLRNVFDNLLDNAVQAMGGVGTVSLAVKSLTVDGTDGFAVSVADEGEGMDTMVRSRAKDPFFTTRPSGTGLGLAIVNRIVEAHGGRLTFDSRSGEGTTVTVFLPIGSESLPPPELRPAMASQPALERILPAAGADAE